MGVADSISAIDEIKDISKKEKMSVVVRYCYSVSVHKSFLHLEAAECLVAAALSEKIILILQNYSLDYKNNPSRARIRWGPSHERDVFWGARVH